MHLQRHVLIIVSMKQTDLVCPNVIKKLHNFCQQIKDVKVSSTSDVPS